MMQSANHMALGVVSVAVVAVALLFRFNEGDVSVVPPEQGGASADFCCVVEHPGISSGLVCAGKVEGLIPEAIKRLALPEECARISIPVDLSAGDKVILSDRGGQCVLERVTPLTGGERLLAGGEIEINTATEADLVLLPGIGRVKARAIVEHRSQNGPFYSLEELAMVHGIGEKTVERLKPWVRVNGEAKREEHRTK